jgi:hypothetical protein
MLRPPDVRGEILRLALMMATLALGFLAAPLAAEAQQAGKVYRIGALQTGRCKKVPDTFWKLTA